MTVLVLLVLVWTFLAVSTAFVVGHGIRLANAGSPVGLSDDEARAVVGEPQATPAP